MPISQKQETRTLSFSCDPEQDDLATVEISYSNICGKQLVSFEQGNQVVNMPYVDLENIIQEIQKMIYGHRQRKDSNTQNAVSPQLSVPIIHRKAEPNPESEEDVPEWQKALEQIENSMGNMDENEKIEPVQTLVTPSKQEKTEPKAKGESS